MTTATLLPDATRCPDCRAVLAGTGACGACGLALTGPAATRLWQVDVELLRLDDRRTSLLAERVRLLASLRTGAPVPVAATPVPAVPAPEWTPKRIQNLLLGLGGLLLAVAALVFAAVTYDRLGAGGRAVVLVLLTATAAWAAPVMRARGLTATAETLGAVTLVLAALDAYGLRTLGLAEDSAALSYAAVSAGVLAAAAAAYAAVVPLQVLRGAAVVLAQLPVPLLLVRLEVEAGTAALSLAALAAADLAALAGARGRLPRPYVPVLAACTALATAVALLVSLGTALGPDPEVGAVALLLCAAVLAGAGVLTGSPLLTGAVVPVVGAAAYGLVRDDEPTASLVLAAIGLLAALAASQLARSWRTGPVLGALAVSAGGLLTVAEPALRGVLLPVTWLLDPWSLAPASSAREALAPQGAWDGTLVTPAVLLAAALAVAAAGLALHRVRSAAIPAAVLAGATAVLLPLGLDLPYAAGLALLLVLSASLAGGAVAALDRSAPGAVVLAVTGAAVLLLACAWSTAAEGATLAVLPVAALLAAATASTRLPVPAVPVGLAGALGTAALAAAGASRALAVDQVGALLVVAVAALLGTAVLLDVARRTGAEIAACTAAVVALVLASGDVGWLSWTLSGLGLHALATALRSDRRLAAPAGALLLAASSWVRLADAGIGAPEPYVLPLAAVALALGHLRRRQVADTPSWAAYAPGLSLALLPSLLASFDHDVPTRALLLGLASLVVLLVGARTSMQAPLTIGGAVLAVDALSLLAPYAAALPRWMSLGAAGVLLVVVGATYEQRLRDVGRLRERYDALS